MDEKKRVVRLTHSELVILVHGLERVIVLAKESGSGPLDRSLVLAGYKAVLEKLRASLNVGNDGKAVTP